MTNRVPRNRLFVDEKSTKILSAFQKSTKRLDVFTAEKLYSRKTLQPKNFTAENFTAEKLYRRKCWLKIFAFCEQEACFYYISWWLYCLLIFFSTIVFYGFWMFSLYKAGWKPCLNHRASSKRNVIRFQMDDALWFRHNFKSALYQKNDQNP